VPSFYISFARGQFVSYATATNTLNIDKEKYSMFKMFVTVDSINASNLLSVKRHLPSLNIRPATLQTRLLVISKFLTICFKVRVTMFSAVATFGSSASAAYYFVAFYLK